MESKERIIAVVQARMGSKRLPDKVMMPILERPMLWHIVSRLKHSTLLDETVVATTEKDKDRPISEMAEKYDFPCYAGKEEDLLDRFYQTAKMFNASAIVRITADCPLVDPALVDKVINVFLKNKYDYVSNARPTPSLPHGMDAEIFSFSLLERLWREIGNAVEREWFTPVISNNPDKYSIFCIKNDIDLSYLRLTVDYPEDLELVRFIYSRLYAEGRAFSLDDVLALASSNKGMFEINKKYNEKEGQCAIHF